LRQRRRHCRLVSSVEEGEEEEGKQEEENEKTG